MLSNYLLSLDFVKVRDILIILCLAFWLLQQIIYTIKQSIWYSFVFIFRLLMFLSVVYCFFLITSPNNPLLHISFHDLKTEWFKSTINDHMEYMWNKWSVA